MLEIGFTEGSLRSLCLESTKRLSVVAWLAGAGVKRGYVHGATDEHGIRAVEKPVHVNDFHATILHLMGINHERLTWRHGGRDYRLTDIAGHVVKDIVS